MLLTHSDKTKMLGLHPDLVRWINSASALSDVPFTILEGRRDPTRQAALVRKGASRTMKSHHLTGRAVDIAPLHQGTPSWHWPHYHKLAPILKKVAADLGIELQWGGDWRTFKDGPHWQLKEKKK